MDGPDLDVVRTLAARVVAQADQLAAERADDPEVARLADALATLAAAAGRLADWAEHWKRGQ